MLNLFFHFNIEFFRHHTTITGNSISLFWPEKYFETDIRKGHEGEKSAELFSPTTEYPPSWWFAVRNNCYLGVYCNQPSTLDTSERNDSKASVIHLLIIIIIIFIFIILYFLINISFFIL